MCFATPSGSAEGTRFNDRSGLGRYGMGLPNSSLSQARRVTVYTWQSGSPAYKSYLDVDEIASGTMTKVPAPRKAKLPFEGDYGEKRHDRCMVTVRPTG